MNNQRYSSIAHGDMPVWNPIGIPHLQTYLSQLALPDGCAVLDIGCGNGNTLNRILTRYRVRAIGVDSSPFAMARASRCLESWIALDRVELIEREYLRCDFPAGSFQLVICMGASHAAGGFVKTLRAAKRLLCNGGLLLIGEGYWRQTPPAEYLEFLQATADELNTHDGNQSRGVEEEFELLACSECSQDEWDAYEEQYARNMENYVQAHGDDPDAAAMLERCRAWRAAYFRWGRATLGFGVYLLQSQSPQTRALLAYFKNPT